MGGLGGVERGGPARQQLRADLAGGAEVGARDVEAREGGPVGEGGVGARGALLGGADGLVETALLVEDARHAAGIAMLGGRERGEARGGAGGAASAQPLVLERVGDEVARVGDALGGGVLGEEALAEANGVGVALLEGGAEERLEERAGVEALGLGGGGVEAREDRGRTVDERRDLLAEAGRSGAACGARRRARGRR